MGALPERRLSVDDAFIASTFVSTRAARTASKRATSMPLPPSSVDTALSATSEVDGVTVTVISSPAFAAAVTSPLSSAAIVAIALVRSVVPRERSARCRNDHKPSSFRFAATALLLSADDSSCRKRDNMKPMPVSPTAGPETEIESERATLFSLGRAIPYRLLSSRCCSVGRTVH